MIRAVSTGLPKTYERIKDDSQVPFSWAYTYNPVTTVGYWAMTMMLHFSGVVY